MDAAAQSKASHARADTCGGVRPVKENMPICDVMCVQSPGHPILTSSSSLLEKKNTAHTESVCTRTALHMLLRGKSTIEARSRARLFLSYSSFRIETMRSAMPFSSTRHAAKSSGLWMVRATMRAPWMGGDEKVGRTHVCRKTNASHYRQALQD